MDKSSGFKKRTITLKEHQKVVVVVVSDTAPEKCHWIITAYIARKIVKGDVEWERN